MSKPHKWEVIKVDATDAGLDIGEFWQCFECGSSGGPTGWGNGRPGSYLGGGFLSGTSLTNLSDDCDDARSDIDAYLSKYPGYKDLVDYERSMDRDEKSAPADEYWPMGKCPMCNEQMQWDEAKDPASHDWCVTCRERVEYLMRDGVDDSERFRKALMNYPDLVKLILKGV